MREKTQTSAAPQRAAGVDAHIALVAPLGDETYWKRLVDRYSGLVWAVARTHNLSGDDAADVVQTTWLRLIEHLAHIRNPAAIGAWLATTARRECLRSLRRAARYRPSDELDLRSDEQVTGADAQLLRDERDAALRHAFNRLPGRDQALLRMLTADPAPRYQEIAAALGVAIGSVGPKRARALERLRRELVAAEATAV
jgi:RNA polymerase sigma factor (sigma-70 family)